MVVTGSVLWLPHRAHSGWDADCSMGWVNRSGGAVIIERVIVQTAVLQNRHQRHLAALTPRSGRK